MERNPYADAIGRESVANARLKKNAAQAKKTKARDTPAGNTTAGTMKHGRPSPTTTTATGTVVTGDPTGMGRDMQATAVQRW